MKKLLKVFIVLFTLFVGICIWLLVFNGRMPWYTEEHATPVMVGERLDGHGQSVQKIFRQINSRSTDVLFTPEGPRKATKYKAEYFLQEKDAALVKMPFLSDRDYDYSKRSEDNIPSDLQFCSKFLSVTNSPLWVAAGIDELGNNLSGYDFHVVVFDEKHVRSHRTFNMRREPEDPDQHFDFTDGNRITMIKTPMGLVEKYDVVTDQVTDLR
jgi:hypothetical protein